MEKDIFNDTIDEFFGKKKVYGTYGEHVTCDMYDIDPEIIDNIHYMIIACEIAAKKTGATVMKTEYVEFEPQGLTIAVILSESHLTVHSSPELGFLAVDVFTCGTNCIPENAIKHLLFVLKPKEYKFNKYIRGVR